MFDICESKLPDPMQGFVNPNPMMSSTFQIPTTPTTMSTKKPFLSSPTTSSPAMDLNLSNNIQSDMKNEDSPKSKKIQKYWFFKTKIKFSKFNGKVGVIFWLHFHLI